MAFPHRIILCDDEERIRNSLSGLLQDHGYEVVSVPNGSECLKTLAREGFDLVILDIIMPDMDGIEVLARIKEKYKDTEVIMITGYPDKEKAIATFRLAAYDFIEKPFESKEILNVVAHCLRQHDLRREVEDKTRELAEAEEKYRDIYDNALDMYQTLDRNGIITECNQASVHESGYSREEMIGRPVYRFYSEESREAFLREFPGAYTKKRAGIERKLITKDGRAMDVMIDVTPILDKGGNQVGLRLIMRDITSRKQAENTLQYLKEYNETIVASLPAALLVLDKDLNIKLVNRAYQDIQGVEYEDVVGKNIKKVFPDRLLKEGGLLRAFEEVMETEETRSLQRVKHTSPHQQEKILNLTVSGVRLGEREGSLILVIEDVTERARATEELKRKNEELETFVYTVSHDLKSPIISMHGFSSILLKEYQERLGEEGKGYIERIKENARHMEVLISDLLALSRLGRTVSSFEDVSSLKIAKRACSNFKQRLEEGRVDVSIGDNLPTIHCDEDRTYKVFENLVSNAIKFMGDTEKPMIEVGYEEKGRFHQFFVRDNGIGIDPKYHRRVFEIFQQLKKVEHSEGTGIGLVIVERIVRNHGGRVWVESEEGEGATFYISVPKEHPHDPEGPPAS